MHYLRRRYKAKNAPYSGVIKGYCGSTANIYANDYNRSFVSLESIPSTKNTTTTTTTTTSTSTTTTRPPVDEPTLGDVNGDNMLNVVDASPVLAFYADLALKPNLTLEMFLEERK